MSQPFLILHKVRGAPAFDIAVRAEFEDGEEYWIVSSSGHRAYPAKWWPLEDLVNAANASPLYTYPYHELNTTSFDDWPDHYTPPRVPLPALATSALSLLSRIGLGTAPLKRRTLK